jgi:hypothetical protein
VEILESLYAIFVVILQDNCWDNNLKWATINSFNTFQENYSQMTLPFESRECSGDSLSVSENVRLVHIVKRGKMEKR